MRRVRGLVGADNRIDCPRWTRRTRSRRSTASWAAQANEPSSTRPMEVTMALSHDAATDRSHIVQANGVKVHYRVDGQGDPLVLLHAGTLSGDMWQPYLAAFT